MSIAKSVVAGSDQLAARVAAAAAVARANALDVDSQARFPQEAFDAIRAQRLLGVMLPEALGGEAATLAQTADLCVALGRACGSTGLIFAMHQVKVACVLRHHAGAAWHQDFLRRVAAEQLLLASSTTEGDAGGAVRSSSAPVERTADGIRLLRAASVISYGEQAGAVVTTARRNPDAAPSDQVLVVLPRGAYRLDRGSGWDTLGMRGTCSYGFALEAWGPPEQILPTPYATIHAQTMVPAAHTLWASVWAGISGEALERARLHLRRKAKDVMQLGPAGAHLAQAKSSHGALRALISGALARHERLQAQPELLETPDYQASISLLKVQASELALDTVMSALRAIGLTGYRNDSETSVARLLRDVLSAPLMISNDRILGDLQPAVLLEQVPPTL